MNSYHHDWMEPLPSETPPPAPEPVVRRRKQKKGRQMVSLVLSAAPVSYTHLTLPTKLEV